MRFVSRTLFALVFLCLLLCLSGCVKQNADSGWVSRTNWYGSMSDTGYYYTDKTKFLYYVDFQSNVNVSLCQKVGCAHSNTGDCEAYLGTERILFWGDHLYYLADDAYGTHLYRRDATGQNLTAIGTLCEDLMREERNISINVVDTLITNGRLYYCAIINKMERDEGGAHSVSYRDVIRYIDLTSGKETTVVESADSRLELIGVREQEMLYSSIIMPAGLTEDNASELLANTTIKIIIRSIGNGDERLLFEKHRSQFHSSVGFTNGMLFYLYYTENEICNVVYNVDSCKEESLPSGFLSVINNRYVLLRDNTFRYTLLDIQKDQQLPVDLMNANISVYCSANQGAIFKYSDRKVEEGQKKLLRYAYIASDALADGLQESDLIVFYQNNMG